MSTDVSVFISGEAVHQSAALVCHEEGQVPVDAVEDHYSHRTQRTHRGMESASEAGVGTQRTTSNDRRAQTQMRRTYRPTRRARRRACVAGSAGSSCSTTQLHSQSNEYSVNMERVVHLNQTYIIFL